MPFPAFDGWYHSGDLARRDAQGYHYFVERKTGLLKVAGMKVYPLQIELVLQAHPAVREVAVVGVEDRLGGVVPKAFLVAREGCRIDADELRRFCRGRLADLMIPQEMRGRRRFPADRQREGRQEEFEGEPARGSAAGSAAGPPGRGGLPAAPLWYIGGGRSWRVHPAGMAAESRCEPGKEGHETFDFCSRAFCCAVLLASRAALLRARTPSRCNLAAVAGAERADR